MGDVIANKSRTLNTDGIAVISRSANFRQYVTQAVNLYVFIPASNQIAARAASDRAEELWQPICQSILFHGFDSLVSAGRDNALVFNGHNSFDYNTAVYIHQYTFEATMVLCVEDTVGVDEHVAFRDIDMTQNQDVGTEEITTLVDLDDVPL